MSLSLGLRRLKQGLRLAFSIAEMLALAIYLLLLFVFRFYIPLKLRRWWNVRRFRRMLVAEGLPEEVASKIAETQFPEVPGLLGFRRLISLGREEQ